MHDFQGYFSGISRNLNINLQDFPAPKWFSRTFHVLEFSIKTPGLSRRRGNPANLTVCACNLHFCYNPEILGLKHRQSRHSGLRKWVGIRKLESLVIGIPNCSTISSSHIIYKYNFISAVDTAGRQSNPLVSTVSGHPRPCRVHLYVGSPGI